MADQEPEGTSCAAPPGGTGRRRSAVLGLNIGHLLADFYGTFPVPLLRTFASHLHVSYASVSMLLGVNAVANGLASITFGLVCDRWTRAHRRTILLAAAVTVLAMSAIGAVGNYWLLMLVMATGAFACGAFHPPGFSSAGDMAHPRRVRGVSIIMATGIVGSGLGPLFVSRVVRSHGGIWATPLCAAPGIALLAVAALLLRGMQEATPPAAARDEHPVPVRPSSPRRWGVVLLLFGNAALRAFAHMSVLVLISKLMEDVWGMSVVASGMGVGALQLGAGLGGLIGARLTPTGRERRTMLAWVPLNLLVLVPMALTGGRIWWLLLFAYGACINGPGPVVVSLAQQIAPQRTALVSGLMVGVAFAVGGQLAAVTSPRLLSSFGQAWALGLLALPLVLSGLAAAGLPARAPSSS